MKKIVLSFVFILAVAIQMSANTDPDKKEDVKKQVITEAEIPGCASDCVQSSSALVFEAAEENGEHPNDDPIYMIAYRVLYYGCLENNCGIIPE